MIVTTPSGVPIIEVTRTWHPTLGVCLRLLQNKKAAVIVPLDTATLLADALVDAVERVEAKL